MFSNPSDEVLADVLREAKTVAVVGLSDDPHRVSYEVGSYLQSQGYELVPINPTIQETLGRKAHASLREVEGPVDIVDVFRRNEAVPAIIDDVLEMNPKPKMVWLQKGIVNDEAMERLRDAGILGVQDACLKVEHSRLLGKAKL
jgi:uncharacterized protein